jgi:hypothetical protein
VEEMPRITANPSASRICVFIELIVTESLDFQAGPHRILGPAA